MNRARYQQRDSELRDEYDKITRDKHPQVKYAITSIINRINTIDAEMIYARLYPEVTGVEIDATQGKHDVGKLFQYNLHLVLPIWSPNIKWAKTNFLTTRSRLWGPRRLTEKSVDLRSRE